MSNIVVKGCLTGCLLGAWSGAAWAECPSAHPPAGIVTKISESDGTLYLLRDSQKLRPFVTQTVCADDRIVTGGAGGMVSVLRTDESARDYKAGDPPILPPGKPSSGWQNFLVAVAGLSRSVEPYGSDNFVGRGGQQLDFAIHGLKANQARLGTGYRSLYVRWKGGAGPFRLALSDGQGRAVAAMDAIPGNAAYLTLPYALAPGRWLLSVTDGGGAQVQGGFQVDAARSFKPAMAGPFAELQSAADAAELANDPLWAFEADQVLAAAPAQGLDHGPVLKTIACKSYGTDLPPDC